MRSAGPTFLWKDHPKWHHKSPTKKFGVGRLLPKWNDLPASYFSSSALVFSVKSSRHRRQLVPTFNKMRKLGLRSKLTMTRGQKSILGSWPHAPTSKNLMIGYKKVNRTELKALNLLYHLDYPEYNRRSYNIMRWMYFIVLPRVEAMLYYWTHRVMILLVENFFQEYFYTYRLMHLDSQDSSNTNFFL